MKDSTIKIDAEYPIHSKTAALIKCYLVCKNKKSLPIAQIRNK